MLRVRGHIERLLLKALSLEETRDPVVLLLGHRRQVRRRGLKVTPHDCRLVLDHRELQQVAHDRTVPVDEVDAVVALDVADDVQRPVEVLQRDRLGPDRVVEPAGRVRVQQAVAHPHARAHLAARRGERRGEARSKGRR